MAELSPMMKQYFETKKKYPDTILMFRLGDFYEMFFDDAVTVSRELELVLTGRACGQEERAPMCGVPFHSADSYMARLVAKGYKVAICEQMEDPALKGTCQARSRQGSDSRYGYRKQYAQRGQEQFPRKRIFCGRVRRRLLCGRINGLRQSDRACLSRRSR